jgi:F-type H+-transporting ATPase subunit alpha
MSVGDQVITIFAGTSGVLDDVPINTVAKFITDFLKWLTNEHPEYSGEITKTGKFSDAIANLLTEALKTFKTTQIK